MLFGILIRRKIKVKYSRQEPVFEELDYVRKQGKSFLHLVKEPRYSNFGDRIEKEFEENERQFSDHKTELSLDWFLAEYISASRDFKRFYNFMENVEKESEIYDFELDIKNCSEMFDKAFKSVERCHRICQEPYHILLSRPRKLVEDELKEMKKNLYFAKEFPETFTQVKNLHKRINDAIQDENYELASMLTKKVEGISDNGLDYQKDLIHTYKENRRFWE